MELFVVFILGVMLGVVGLVLVRPGLLVKPREHYTMLEDLAEELITRIEQYEARLDDKYEEIAAAIAEREQRLLRLSEEIVSALKSARSGLAEGESRVGTEGTRLRRPDHREAVGRRRG